MKGDIATGVRVMIVEDELLIASTLEFVLEAKGYQVIGPVAMVAAALELLAEGTPDIALLDYRLATTTTEALLPSLDALKIPVCVLTGYGRAQLPPAYAGYVVLEKPFAMKTLIDTLAQLVSPN
jgi:DNA-binding NtrC family response regulator